MRRIHMSGNDWNIFEDSLAPRSYRLEGVGDYTHNPTIDLDLSDLAISDDGRRVVIVGSSQFAELAAIKFSEVGEVPRVVLERREYINQLRVGDINIVRFSERWEYIEDKLFVAIGYREQNKIRADFFNQLKKEGFYLTNYISSASMIDDCVMYGDNNFIFEFNNIQPFVEIGDDNIFWSMNHIGHGTVIGNHNFIASHVVISGNVEIGDFCFFGVNATIGNDIKIADGSVIGAGAVVVKDTKPWTLYLGNPAKEYDISKADEFFKK